MKLEFNRKKRIKERNEKKNRKNKNKTEVTR